jgi:hypothetical protein
VYYIFSTGVLIGFVVMVNKIRHINDDTKIKAECATILALWLILAVPQFFLCSLLFIQRCDTDFNFKFNDTTVNELYYVSLIIRDLLTAALTLYFQVKVNRDIRL